MYSLRMKLNDQKPNTQRLLRLQRSFEKSGPEDVMAALCSVAVAKLHDLTPRGKQGKMRAGWTHRVARKGGVLAGTVYNTAEETDKGKLILAVLEKGSSYKQAKIYPKVATVLAFFWERYDMMIFRRWVLSTDKKGFHMVRETKRFMRTVYRHIAEIIMAKRIKEATR